MPNQKDETKETTTSQKQTKVIKEPNISYQFFGVPEEEQKIIKELIKKNIAIKLDSYLKSIYSGKKDAEIKISYKIQKNKKHRYEASFYFLYDGKTFIYKNKTAFKYVADVVNHAFKHFTRHVSERK